MLSAQYDMNYEMIWRKTKVGLSAGGRVGENQKALTYRLEASRRGCQSYSHDIDQWSTQLKCAYCHPTNSFLGQQKCFQKSAQQFDILTVGKKGFS